MESRKHEKLGRKYPCFPLYNNHENKNVSVHPWAIFINLSILVLSKSQTFIIDLRFSFIIQSDPRNPSYWKLENVVPALRPET